MEALNWIAENYEKIFEVAAYIIAGASVIAALTPNTKDDEVVGKAGSWLTKIRTFVNILALNLKKK
jgi:hypothetical protein